MPFHFRITLLAVAKKVAKRLFRFKHLKEILVSLGCKENRQKAIAIMDKNKASVLTFGNVKTEADLKVVIANLTVAELEEAQEEHEKLRKVTIVNMRKKRIIQAKHLA